MSASATRPAPIAEPLAVTLAAQAIALAQAAAREDQLATWREQARKQLASLAFPDKRTEQWKYTRLTTLDGGHLKQAAAPLSDKDLPFDLPEALAPCRLVLINGHYQPALSNPPAQGLSLTRLDGSASVPLTVTDDSLRTPFAWLNSAALADGLVLNVPDGVALDSPVEVLMVSSGDQPAVCHPRLRLNLGSGSRATLIERYIGGGAVLTNAVTELFTGIGSDLVHYRLQAERDDALHIGTLVINPGRDSRAHSFQLMQGSALRRNDVRVLLDGSGAHAGLNGIFVGQGKTHTDNQICVEHRAAHASSEQVFKGMAGDQAKLVFNGRIHIFEGARGTHAELSNKNLLLTDGAEVDTKPELEIYNDDVKCSHGTTCGQLDAQGLFYLRSRGVPQEEAKRMLAFGFVNELLGALPDTTVADWARPWLESALTDETARA